CCLYRFRCISFFFLLVLPPPRSTLFPYTTLFRSRRAVEGIQYECLKETFTGPTLIAFSAEHPGAAARIFKEFAKKNKEFELKGRSEEHTSELQSRENLVCRLLLEKKKKHKKRTRH